METINSQTPIEPPEAGSQPLRVLIVEDSGNDALVLLFVLRKAGYKPIHERVWTAAGMRQALEKQSWDIVISDYEMPGFGGFEALQILRESGQDLPFILVSAVVSEETAVAAMKAGAHDYIMKRKTARLGPAIARELREAQMRAAQRASEAALHQSEEQLRQAQKLEAIARLASGVAHDFNNILTAIIGNSDMLVRQLTVGDSKRKHVEQIQQCAQMAAGLTRQLLTFSRKQVIEPRVVELNDIIRNIEKMLRRLIGEDIEFRTALDPAAGHIKADPGQIEQVIMNLAVNARDAMPNGGKLLATTANLTLDEPGYSGFTTGNYVMLSFSDTGNGMTDEVKAHLFEPFFTTKPAGKGTGLGLATCFGIVQQSAGHIQVESAPGKGTTFKLYFPSVEPPLEQIPGITVAPPVATGTETLLLVEDESLVRELAGSTLREHGYTVLEAGNGEEGLRLARKHRERIDLVVTDVIMPVMSGKEMTDHLRSCHPESKVLFTSGYTEESIAHHGVLRPGIAFLQKPYQPNHLARRVREVLDAKG